MILLSSLRRILPLVATGSLFWLSACKDAPATAESPAPIAAEPVAVPAFSKDSAYAFVARQVAFGPRVPGTPGHTATREWLVAKFKAYGANVTEQTFKVNSPTVGQTRGTNIIAAFNPTYANRVVLAAHWDTRFAADEDDTRPNDPHDGADDGGSGVGVLLEIARLVGANTLPIGVDIVLFDAEDQGTSDGPMENWCLGAQHWAKNPHVKGYRASYGILLDMVGAKGAVFPKEDVTGVFPPDKVRAIHRLYDNVWSMARGMNHGGLFVDHRASPFTDDHYFVNLHTDIPMIDIIHRPQGSSRGFGPHWHTHDDAMSVIDAGVLGAVGQVVTAYVYNSARKPL
jgi:glutaminyl-peptide cyclotransferase